MNRIMPTIMLRTIVVSALFGALLLPSSAYAFEVSGWVPYWSGSRGTKDTVRNMDALTVVMPFSHTITRDGSLKDNAGLKKSTWKRLIREARSEGVLVVPTIMTGDGALVHELLSDPERRAEHIEEIVEFVERGGYDGIDIDYEGKRAATREDFSRFLRELKDALGDKILSCTIEARTPPKDLYRTVPATLEYANDLDEINNHCDRVNVMAYDQQRADLSLNDARKGLPYIPVADSAWVEKVMKHMARDIDEDKLFLGIATYGAEWELTVEPEWFKEYKKLWALNPSYAYDTAKKQKAEIGRTAAGEAAFTYLPKSARKTVGRYDAPRGTPEWAEAAGQALAYANDTGKATVVHVVWWSDTKAVEEKVALAKKLGLAGVAVFKLDGGQDRGFWSVVK